MVLRPNDDDPAVAAPEPHHLPLLNDDVTEPWPVPSPPPKKVIDINIELKRYLCQNCCPPWPFNNNSYKSDDVVSCPEPPFSNNSYSSDDDCTYYSSTEPPFNNNSYNSYNLHTARHLLSCPEPPFNDKMRSWIISHIWTKSSSSINWDLKCYKGQVMVKVRTTPADIIDLENNTRIIPEEEAVCRFCFQQLFPVNNDHNNNNNNVNNNVLMTRCLCLFTLTHEHCATEWSGKKGNTKCDVCDQDTDYIPVTLSTTSEEKSDKVSSISTLKKWSCFRTD